MNPDNVFSYAGICDQDFEWSFSFIPHVGAIVFGHRMFIDDFSRLSEMRGRKRRERYVKTLHSFIYSYHPLAAVPPPVH